MSLISNLMIPTPFNIIAWPAGLVAGFLLFEIIFYTVISATTQNLVIYGTFHDNLWRMPIRSLTSNAVRVIVTFSIANCLQQGQSGSNEQASGSETTVTVSNEEVANEASLPPPYSMNFPNTGYRKHEIYSLAPRM